MRLCNKMLQLKSIWIMKFICEMGQRHHRYATIAKNEYVLKLANV